MRPGRALALLAALVFVPLLLMAGFGYAEAIRTPAVVRQTIALPGLAPGTQLRVLLLADTHFGRPDMTRQRIAAIVAQGNALKPDLVLLAGDYNGGKLLDMEGSPAMEPAVRPFADFRAPLGVFAVTGNHDSAKWAPLVFGRQGSPRLLENQAVDLGPIGLAGSRSVIHGSCVSCATLELPAGKPALLLLHEGDQLLDEQRPDRPILALGGHTHGGQILLPWLGAPADLGIGRPACRRGFCVLNGWPLFVTSGVGTSWVPLRLNVPPELVLLTLVPECPGLKPRAENPAPRDSVRPCHS